MLRMIKCTGLVALLLGLGATLQADETKGTIKTVDTSRREVVLKGVVKDTVYEMTKDATFWLDGLRCKIGDLKTDDRANIIYSKSGDHLMASQVRGLRNAQETSGTVNDVLGDKREIVLKGTVKNTTYELAKEGTVHINGQKASLKEIRSGDEVMVTYQTRGDRHMANDVTVYRRNK